MADYTLLLKMQPTASNYELRGILYEESGRLPQALADYRKSMELNSSNDFFNQKVIALEKKVAAQSAAVPAPALTAEQYLNQGLERAGKKDYAGAVRSFSECLRLAPNASGCYAHRGSAHGMNGSLAAAEADFAVAVRMNPREPTILLMRAVIYDVHGKRDAATADVRAALRLDPNNAPAKQMLRLLEAAK